MNNRTYPILQQAESSTYQPQWIKADFADFLLAKINPLWSVNKIKARITAQQPLSADMYAVSVKTNAKFSKQWQAGQSVLVNVQIAGVYHQRSYSIVDMDMNGQIILGIKAQGMVSRYLTKKSNIYLELSQAQGDFVLHQGQKPALLIASGSGMTAIYALLKQALKQSLSEIYVLYFNRDDVYHAEILALQAQYPQLQYKFINTRITKQHFEQDLLAEFCPIWMNVDTYLCGAPALMRAVNTLYAFNPQPELLHSEYFQPVIEASDGVQQVVFRRSQQQFESQNTLLIDAEQAGLKPSFGCRMGICNSCSCTKVSGTTKNILTGELDSEHNQQIRLCISQAVSPVVIDA